MLLQCCIYRHKHYVVVSAAEGKSYQGVKDALRRDAAIHLLLNPDLTLEDVAQQVGFSETSTFHRAFKKWTGVTPGLYRQLHGYH